LFKTTNESTKMVDWPLHQQFLFKNSSVHFPFVKCRLVTPASRSLVDLGCVVCTFLCLTKCVSDQEDVPNGT